eukprot:CAMPEP_0182856804 /NCGR_PEP_ID=MMETSP0034_2-20130328/2665_1 /TAXON_ID=156128 /ORGANISM="Nephroselmis pyriformis, Strain CCMP717" /LENGTH=569 /DNA_ID=CAMNT_0024987947 /DNA_START=283 /DNA_END=1989 /DNA_ORIENTATION=-
MATRMGALLRPILLTLSLASALLASATRGAHAATLPLVKADAVGNASEATSPAKAEDVQPVTPVSLGLAQEWKWGGGLPTGRSDEAAARYRSRDLQGLQSGEEDTKREEGKSQMEEGKNMKRKEERKKQRNQREERKKKSEDKTIGDVGQNGGRESVHEVMKAGMGELVASRTRDFTLSESLAAVPPPSGFDEGCLRRDWTVPPIARGAAGQLTRVGVVIVFCTETPKWLLGPLKCEDTSYYFYSKCNNIRWGGNRNPRGTFTLEFVPHIAACSYLMNGNETALSAVPYVKVHAAYLHHVITHYDRLHPQMVFIKGVVKNLGGELDVADAVAKTRAHDFAFKPWGRKSPEYAKEAVSMNKPPVETDTNGMTLWQTEMCGWWERYICSHDCGKLRLWYNPHTLFSASRERLLSLPRGEYSMLLRYALQLNGFSGVMRRFALERVWHMMLGCPEDMVVMPNSKDEARVRDLGGCRAGEHFGSGAAVLPHRAHFPGYPPNKSPMTFVVFLTSRARGGDYSTANALRRALEAAMLTHPWAELVVLSDGSDREGAEFLNGYFGERVRVMEGGAF